MLHELDFMCFVYLDLVGTTEVINVKVRAYRSTEREPHVVDKTEMWAVKEDSLSRWRDVTSGIAQGYIVATIMLLVFVST